MNNEWSEGTDGLAEFLIADSRREADVQIEYDGLPHNTVAAWDSNTLMVICDAPSRCIERWRPKREPLVLTGDIWSGDEYIHIPLDNTPVGTHFTYTLEEVL